jgi:hypothetical protein
VNQNLKLVCEILDGNVVGLFGDTVHLALDMTAKIAIGPDMVLRSHPAKGEPVKMEVMETYRTWSRPNPAWIGQSSLDFQLDRTTLVLHVVVAFGVGTYLMSKGHAPTLNGEQDARVDACQNMARQANDAKIPHVDVW